MNSSNTSFTPALGRILATVSVGFVVTQLDVTIVNIALPKIALSIQSRTPRPRTRTRRLALGKWVNRAERLTALTSAWANR
jgi:hypothetical protein